MIDSEASRLASSRAFSRQARAWGSVPGTRPSIFSALCARVKRSLREEEIGGDADLALRFTS